MSNAAHSKMVAIIAREDLGIESLALRGRDALDFHELHVTSIERALGRAYQAGAAAALDPITKWASEPLTDLRKIRTRCGSWRTFDRRFGPLDGPDGSAYWRREQLPADIDVHLVWTIVDGGNGKLYVSPGWRYVNRLDYVVCSRPWTDDDLSQPDYRYD